MHSRPSSVSSRFRERWANTPSKTEAPAGAQTAGASHSFTLTSPLPHELLPNHRNDQMEPSVYLQIDSAYNTGTGQS